MGSWHGSAGVAGPDVGGAAGRGQGSSGSHPAHAFVPWDNGIPASQPIPLYSDLSHWDPPMTKVLDLDGNGMDDVVYYPGPAPGSPPRHALVIGCGVHRDGMAGVGDKARSRKELRGLR